MSERKVLRTYWLVYSNGSPWSSAPSLLDAQRETRELNKHTHRDIRITKVTVYAKPRLTEADVAKAKQEAYEKGWSDRDQWMRADARAHIDSAVKDELWRVTGIFLDHAHGRLHWTKSVGWLVNLLREDACTMCGGEGFIHVSVTTMTCPTCKGVK